MSGITSSFPRLPRRSHAVPVSCSHEQRSPLAQGEGKRHGRSNAQCDLQYAGMSDIHERAAVLALVSQTDSEWYRLASLIEEAGSALRILKKDWTGFESFEFISREDAERLAERVSSNDLAHYEDMIEGLELKDIALVTVLDEGYPRNLRLVFNRPPFLFIRGTLLEEDNNAVAVVGTRAASEEGLAEAANLARGLAENGVTVLSGLAHGIDGAAHRSALDAGGRTVAVMGTGMNKPVYPEANRRLAEEIVASGGALISQFWPDHPPMGASFPMRNVVMSGMAIGTVVIEANSTSGAKNQARRALEHGKRLFLVESLVMHEKWAQDYSQRPGATVVKSVDDILDVLVMMAKPTEQLTLT